MRDEDRSLLMAAMALLDKIGRGHPMAGKRTEARALVKKMKNRLDDDLLQRVEQLEAVLLPEPRTTP